MKTQIIFTCARCGKEQVENLNCFTVRKFNYRLLTRHTFPDGKVENELCKDCYRSLQIWLRNGDEYKVLIDENKHLKVQNDWLNNERINLRSELNTVTKEYENCKMFCPRDIPDYNEYMKGYDKWYEKKHKDDIR